MNNYTRTPNIPQKETRYGYCKCGCGQKTNLAPQTHRKMGWIKGEPFRYCLGHGGLQPIFEERFWKDVCIIDDESSCWIWKGLKDELGYGRFSYRHKIYLAHRIAWQLAHGEIPNGLQCLHRCDNPSCVRESHLFLGTNEDNHQDKIKKGRQYRPIGEKHPGAKITEKNVRQIRKAWASGGITQIKIGRIFGIGQAQVNSIIHRRTWRHIE